MQCTSGTVRLLSNDGKTLWRTFHESAAAAMKKKLENKSQKSSDVSTNAALSSVFSEIAAVIVAVAIASTTVPVMTASVSLSELGASRRCASVSCVCASSG